MSDRCTVPSAPVNKVHGKTVVITGAARGIGLATAQKLLARGAHVVIGDRDADMVESAVADLGALGRVSGHWLDVTDPMSFAAFVDRARDDAGGRIDVLINNAGVMPIGPFLQQSRDVIRSSIDVNFFGVVNGCQLVLPEMLKYHSGHIINVASLAGVVALPGQALYAGTKFAVVGLSTALADEFAPQGIDVTVLMPSFTNTALISGTTTTGLSKPIEPEVVAAAVIRALDKPKTHVSVPVPLRFSAALAAMLGPRGRRWLSKRLGLDRAFLDFDATARMDYEARVDPTGNTSSEND